MSGAYKRGMDVLFSLISTARYVCQASLRQLSVAAVYLSPQRKHIYYILTYSFLKIENNLLTLITTLFLDLSSVFCVISLLQINPFFQYKPHSWNQKTDFHIFTHPLFLLSYTSFFFQRIATAVV